MDKLKQLESFVSVATRGSLTAAAEKPGVSRSTIYRKVQQYRSAGGKSEA